MLHQRVMHAVCPNCAQEVSLTFGETFTLHSQLAADTVEVTRGDCCRFLLMNDATYPWLILVPQRPALRDFHYLAEADMAATVAEIGTASRALQALFAPAKINVAALGNMVEQLHIHVIARQTGDAAWPKPVWGVVPARAYAPAALSLRVASLREALAAAR
jgi:diadenosine tetraphosphate (Ap4A) HIT family hydrolase